MVDIHTHILPTVDDGSPDLETSLSLIEDAVKIGVMDLFLTPHYMRLRDYRSPASENRVIFSDLERAIHEKDLPIRLHLGTEIYYTIDTIQDLRNQTVIPLGKSKLVLLEFSTGDDHEDIGEAIHNIRSLGFVPILAHMERYHYATDADWAIAKKMGALIQVNAASVMGMPRHSYQNQVLRMIKKGMVDFVASDLHRVRSNRLKDAYVLIKKKFGENVADHLFKNPLPLQG